MYFDYVFFYVRLKFKIEIISNLIVFNESEN